jgi:glucose-specific phosphotransferase system IIA component
LSDNHTIIEIPAIVDGEVLPIEQVDDQIFSNKMIGDGYAIQPTGNIIYSPVDGKIEQTASTKHAIYLSMAEDIKLLIHIGIDTIELKGKGFKSTLEKGMSVKKGDPLVEFDPELIAEEGFNPVVTVVLLDSSEKEFDITVFPKEKAVGNKTLAMEISIQ